MESSLELEKTEANVIQCIKYLYSYIDKLSLFMQHKFVEYDVLNKFKSIEMHIDLFVDKPFYNQPLQQLLLQTYKKVLKINYEFTLYLDKQNYLEDQKMNL